MTLDELKAADQTTKDNIGLKMYQQLVALYYDQMGSTEVPEVKIN